MANAVRNFFWRRRFRKNLARTRRGREVSASQTVRSIAVYYAYENAEEWKRLTSFWAGMKTPSRDIYILVYDPAHVLESSSKGIIIMDEKDLAFSRMPRIKGKNEVLTSFFSARYDLFADFSREFHGVDAAVASMVHAKLKVGKGGEWGTKACDMILEPSEGDSYVNSFARTMQEYLPILCKFDS